MLDWLLDPFSGDLLGRALVAGLLVATTTAIVGTWVVVRGLAFLGEALTHGLLPGIAVATTVGVDATVGAAVAAVVMVGGIDVVSRRTRLGEDTGIGLLFVGMLALGVVLISRGGNYAGDLTAILFGDVLAVRPGQLWLQAVVLAVTAAVAVVLHRPFTALAFDEDKAAALGLRPRLAHTALLALLALSVVASFRAVGTLLVFGLLVAPAATASLLVRRLPAMTAVAVVLGWSSVVVGLVLSYHADTAAAATIAAVAVAQFFVALGTRELLSRSRRTSPRGRGGGGPG